MSPQVSIFLHDSLKNYAELLASVVGTSRSEIVSDCIRYIKENVDEKKIWEDYDNKLEAHEDALEEAKKKKEEE